MNRQFELERMGRLAADLQKLIIKDQEEITEYFVKSGKDPSGATCSVENWEAIDIRNPWRTLDDHRWFRRKIRIPEKMAGQKAVLSIVTGREGQWDATNPQMLLYLDGNLIQAADVNHRELLITECGEAGEEHELAILAYSGSVPGDLVIHTYLQAIDETVRKICYDISVPLDTARLIYNVDEDNCRKILMVLAAAGDVLDMRVPYSENFYASLKKAEQILKEAFYSEVNENAPVVSAIGHTHIDIAWLWTVSQTREKALRSFSTVLSLMRKYPDYKFMSSQPILYQFVKEQAPEIYEEIRQRVAEGRWEVDGAMWLEADCNVTGGESLVRQILKGHKFFMTEFGKESRSLWLPDAFGYSAALPQILKKSGIPYFMTTKISWNQYNQLPNDMFQWRGLDGSEVFTYMPTACDFDKSAGLNISFSDKRNTTTYTAVINPNMVLGTHKRFQNHDLTDNTLMLFGFGDGGGGPTAEMLENAERLKYGLPGLPRLQVEGEMDFFDRIYEETADKQEMPVWDGELYFEYHRGTLTSMAKNKRNNRKSEILYEQLETLSALAWGTGYEYPEETIRKGWGVILLNQFHDIIPGTCIEEVYDNTDIEYRQILSEGNEEVRKAADAIAKSAAYNEKKDTIIVINTTGYKRNDLVILPETDRKISSVRSADGKECAVQYTADGAVFFAENLPSVGFRKFYPIYVYEDYEDIAATSADVRVDSDDTAKIWDGIYENQFYKVTFNEQMQIVSLIEKSDNREYIREGMAGNVLCTYEDRPMNWDNWDIDEYYRRKPYEADWVSAPVVRENGDVETVIEYSLGFGNSTVTQKVYLYKDLPRIDFRTTAEWNTHHVLLRVNFPVEVNANRASFEIQFGNVERETTCNQSWDSAKFEVCGHKWADISEYNGGVSLLNDCKYGYGVKNGNLSMTLIKSGTYPNPNADIGHHEFTYSIYPHYGRWQEARTVEMAYDLNVPLFVSLQKKDRESGAADKICRAPESLKPAGQVPENLISCDRRECFLETVKRSEDGKDWIVRMYENHNCRVRASIHIGLPVERVEECDLMERSTGEIPVEDGTFSVLFKPYEIKTFRLILDRSRF